MTVKLGCLTCGRIFDMTEEMWEGPAEQMTTCDEDPDNELCTYVEVKTEVWKLASEPEEKRERKRNEVYAFWGTKH
jgi:hypothetical protein